MTDTLDHRAVWIDCLILLADGSHRVREGVVTDLSVDGLWIEVPGPAPRAQTISVVFTPPGWRRALTVRARVQRVSEGVEGCGLAVALRLHPSVAVELDRSLHRLPMTLPLREPGCVGPSWVGSLN